VAITAPSSGANVTGTATTVSAVATDNVGVVGVQFQLDGVNLGSEVVTGPYDIAWNTAAAANGAHTLTPVARDAAADSTTSPAVTVIVSNLPPTTTTVVPTKLRWYDVVTRTFKTTNGKAMVFEVDLTRLHLVGMTASDPHWFKYYRSYFR